jgi:7TMR-DISM extracellular 2/7TM diverse intracellular signalling
MKQRQLTCLFFCTFLGLMWVQAHAQTPLVYRGGELKILPNCQALPDPTGQLTFAQVASPRFTPYASLPHFIADGAEVGWLRFQLGNQSADSALVLDIFNLFDSAELYIVREGSLFSRGVDGADLTHSKKTYFLGQVRALPLLLPPGQTQTYYLRVQQKLVQNIQQKVFFKRVYTVSVKTAAEVLHTHEKSKTFSSFYAGLVLIMAFYSFVLFFNVRDRSYLLFALYLAVTTLQSVASFDFIFRTLTATQYSYIGITV